MSQRTINALLSRDFDNKLAERLAAKGFTLAKLKQMTSSKLNSLGLSKHNIDTIYNEPRPPIPEKSLINILYKNRRTCCICHREGKAIIVHHIIEWAETRDHSEDNLAVLCLECHDLAHTQKKLSQNLSPKELINNKKTWEKMVSQRDVQTILRLKSGRGVARWDWINIHRVFELLNSVEYELIDSPIVRSLKKLNIIDDRGFLKDSSQWLVGKKNQNYFIDFGGGYDVASYLSSILEEVVSTLPIIDITPILNKRSEIKALVENGSYIAVQAPFYFSATDKNALATDEVKTAYYQGYNLRIEFTFQPWFCTSCSAKHGSMAGRHVQTVFGFVRDISSNGDELLISLSCLGTGTAFKRHEQKVKTIFE
jgi:hypothetical protein